MVLGTTVRTLARQVPNYHLVSPHIARSSITLCPCISCARSFRTKIGNVGHLVCCRVFGKTEDDGHAIVAENGTCDRAEFRKECGECIRLEGETR